MWTRAHQQQVFLRTALLFGPTVMLPKACLTKLVCPSKVELSECTVPSTKVFPWTATLVKITLPFVIELHVKKKKKGVSQHNTAKGHYCSLTVTCEVTTDI